MALTPVAQPRVSMQAAMAQVRFNQPRPGPICIPWLLARHLKPFAYRPLCIPPCPYRTRAATRIQAAWRAYRVRRLYLRLQRRLGGAGAELREDSYCGVREVG